MSRFERRQRLVGFTTFVGGLWRREKETVLESAAVGYALMCAGALPDIWSISNAAAGECTVWSVRFPVSHVEWDSKRCDRTEVSGGLFVWS